MKIIITDDEIIDLVIDPHTQEKGFRLLINQFKEKVYYQIKRLIIHHDDVDEVLQIVWIKVWQNLHAFKRESSLSTWIYRIAYNESITYIQNQKKKKIADWETVAPALEENISSNDFEEDEIKGYSKSEILRTIEKAIDSLPEKQKYIFQLRYFEELPYAEIAKITGTTEGALKASYHHAVKKIEAKFKD
ncbi:MAG: RNA polymerase sigma factor [Chitinophagales bacterium]|jgi:RNA polymerase sigma-70 factor (ECF subfamily)|nr:RNA polymerase sigma factor [Chitinophagales bacterium]